MIAIISFVFPYFLDFEHGLSLLEKEETLGMVDRQVHSPRAARMLASLVLKRIGFLFIFSFTLTSGQIDQALDHWGLYHWHGRKHVTDQNHT